MKNILVFGDSNSWGYDYTTYDPAIGSGQRMTPDERWPGRLQKMLGSEYNVIEDCLNGRTSVIDDPYFPNRVGLTSLKVALDAHAPLDLVIIKLGCNELKSMFNRHPGMIAFGVGHLVDEALKSYYNYPAPKVLVLAPGKTHPGIGDMIFGFNFGPDAYNKSCQFGERFKLMAEGKGVEFLDCGALPLEINTLDGLHYSKADHVKVADAVYAKVKEILG